MRLFQFRPAIEADRLENAFAVKLFVDEIGDRTGEMTRHRKKSDSKFVLVCSTRSLGRKQMQIQPGMTERDQDEPRNRGGDKSFSERHEACIPSESLCCPQLRSTSVAMAVSFFAGRITTRTVDLPLKWNSFLNRWPPSPGTSRRKTARMGCSRKFSAASAREIAGAWKSARGMASISATRAHFGVIAAGRQRSSNVTTNHFPD